MITRNKYVPGYYINLLKGNDNDEVETVNISNIKKERNNEINIDNLIKLINYNILRKLKSSRRGGLTCFLKIIIRRNLCHLLYIKIFNVSFFFDF